MARGSKYLPVMEVFAGENAFREFELYQDGSILDISGATATISASFNGTVKFTQGLIIVLGTDGKAILAGADRYDEDGDWEASIQVIDVSTETMFTEEFIIRVKTPGGM